MARLTFSIVAVPVLLALLGLQASADDVQKAPEQKVGEKAAPTQLIFGFGDSAPAQPGGEAPAEGPDVLNAVAENLEHVLNNPTYQPVLAGSLFLFGFVCLLDGARSFQLLVVIAIGVLTSCFMSTQLESCGRIMGTVAAAEVGIFVGFAAWMGWEGTQLLLGLGAGWYLYHIATALIALFHTEINKAHLPNVHEAENTKVVAGYTIAIVVGSFLINNKGGAQRAFAILAPLVGAAFFAATGEYLLMFYCTTPQGAQAFKVHLTVQEIPSIFDFLYMIIFPLHSRSVGFFSYTNSNVRFHGKTYEMDKIIGVCVWIVLAVMGAVGQCKKISKDKLARMLPEENDLNKKLLDNKPNV